MKWKEQVWSGEEKWSWHLLRNSRQVISPLGLHSKLDETRRWQTTVCGKILPAACFLMIWSSIKGQKKKNMLWHVKIISNSNFSAINKVFLEQSHTHYLCVVYGCFGTKTAEASNDNRGRGSEKPEVDTIWLSAQKVCRSPTQLLRLLPTQIIHNFFPLTLPELSFLSKSLDFKN